MDTAGPGEPEDDALIETRELLLRLKVQLDAGPPTDEAVTIAGVLADVRRTLAAREQRRDMIAEARVSGFDQGWGHGFSRGRASGYGAGWRAACEATEAGAAPLADVIPIRAAVG